MLAVALAVEVVVVSEVGGCGGRSVVEGLRTAAREAF